MAKIIAVVVFTLSLSLASGAGAQNLDMSSTDRSDTFESTGKPKRGMTQASVQASYGTPQNSRPAIGEPPITRWEYANFVVFFEFDRVIHSVSK